VALCPSRTAVRAEAAAARWRPHTTRAPYARHGLHEGIAPMWVWAPSSTTKSDFIPVIVPDPAHVGFTDSFNRRGSDQVKTQSTSSTWRRGLHQAVRLGLLPGGGLVLGGRPICAGWDLIRLAVARFGQRRTGSGQSRRALASRRLDSNFMPR
jgi:hypothetical protein